MKNRLILLAALCFILCSNDVFAQAWIPFGQAILGASEGDECGNAIDLNDDGTVIAVASWKNEDNGNDAGSVRVFKFENNSWKQIGDTIRGIEGEKKGYAVSINTVGDVVAFSTPYYNSNTGKVSIYRNLDGVWTQMGDDIIGEYGQYVASGIAIDLNADGNLIAVSNHGAGKTNQGAGIISLYSFDNNIWTRIAEIEGKEWNEQLGGGGLMFNNDATFLAARPSSGTYYPYLRIFRKSTEGNWEQVGDSIPEVRSTFSTTPDFSHIVTGNTNWFGTVRVFKNENDTFVQQGNNIEGWFTGTGFATSTAISSDGNTVIVSAPGDNYSTGRVRTYQFDGIEWRKSGEDLIGDGQYDSYGTRICLSRNDSILAISAPSNDKNGEDAGQVRIFKYAEIHTVIFEDYDGNILKTEIVIQDSSATAPEAPTREGYSFSGWDKDFSTVTSDLTVTAVYVETTYSATFQVSHGTTVLAGATIQINEESFTTNSDGRITVENLSPGTYIYTVTLSEYQEFTGELSIVNSNISENVVLIAVGIDDIHSSKFTVYPNPSSGILNIQAGSSSLSYIHVSVYNMNSKLLYSKSHLCKKSFRIDLSHLPKGHYIIGIDTDDETIHKKIALN